MPIIYLSPSTQENNLYVNGGTEEEWMNRLADAMEPYLTAAGIRFSRGIVVFYYPSSTEGKRAAQLIANGLKTIYPLPNKVRAESTTSIGEVRRVRAPSVFLELGYHDNPDDAAWVQNNLDAIARNIVLSLTEYFGLPFLEPQSPRPAVVDVSWGYLNIRDKPSTTAAVLARAYDGTRLTILNQWEDWYVVRLDGMVGWANSQFITLL